MNHDLVMKPPAECSPVELSRFELMVRLGFDGSDATLRDRMARAECLAFDHDAGGELVGIAGLKRPGGRLGREIFAGAHAGVLPGDEEPELGWVFVRPGDRGRGVAWELCRRLLARVGQRRVFATTRPDNAAMIHLLEKLGFVRVGDPFRRGGKSLSLFLRSPPSVPSQRRSNADGSLTRDAHSRNP